MKKSIAMLLSMTGFGKAVVELTNKKITVEIKSLNSKQLDISMRVPSAYREKELELRNLIGHRLERGKIEVSIFVEATGAEMPVQLNIPVLAAYKAQIEEMSRQLSLPEPADWYSVLLRFPEAMKSDVQSTIDETEADALMKAISEAVEALMQFRTQEGRKLEEFFAARVSHISDLLAEVPRYEVERVAKIRTRIEENISKLAVGTIDPSRLEQEMIFYIEKLDINEEKQRLSQHLNYFMETMNAGFGQGKKLGFISQEMGREINTLGSKSNHADMQRLVVKMHISGEL